MRLYAFSNFGISMRSIRAGMEQAGEIVFDHVPTEEELLTAFPGRTGALAACQGSEPDLPGQIQSLEARIQVLEKKVPAPNRPTKEV